MKDKYKLVWRKMPTFAQEFAKNVYEEDANGEEERDIDFSFKKERDNI